MGCCYKSAVYSYHFRFAGQVRRPPTSGFCVGVCAPHINNQIKSNQIKRTVYVLSFLFDFYCVGVCAPTGLSNVVPPLGGGTPVRLVSVGG